MLRIGLILVLIGCAYTLQGQGGPLPPDTAAVEVEEVIVTTQRGGPVARSQAAVPVTVIQREQLLQIGAQRLDAVLAEQDGIVLTQDLGTGLQLQGIESDYILILINGEPIIGRTGGTLDLTRLTVENIERIEVLKGPASSLYGSEALGGVVNIITREPVLGQSADVRTRYGTNNTADLGLSTGLRKGGFSAQLSLNRYSSAGYDLNPEVVGPTVSPFANYTGTLQVGQLLGTKWKAELGVRGFWEDQSPELATPDNQRVTGEASQREYNLHPSLTYYASDALKLRLHTYSTRYETREDLRVATTDAVFSQTFFAQTFQRPELQADVTLSDTWSLVTGGGGVFETIEATRYSQKQRQQTVYGFFQADFVPSARLRLSVGARLDATDRYGSQLSPKFSARYQLSEALSLRASVGVGFKAPDFRQLYLNFTNAAIGYSVFGTVDAARLVAELESLGQISDLFIPRDQIGEPLAPETSVGINVGGEAKLSGRVRVGLNLFFNQIDGLIETYAIARKVNNQSVFSYRNLGAVQTYGSELSLRWQPLPGLQLASGYQFLQTLDVDVARDVRDGRYFVRNAQGRDVELSRSDYRGLFNRSAHTANIRAFYQHDATGWEGSLRLVYRSEFGLFDTNGNGILDAYDTTVPGYAQVNLTLGKRLGKALIVQLGADNLFDYTDPDNLSGVPGRLLYAALQLRLHTAPKASANP